MRTSRADHGLGAAHDARTLETVANNSRSSSCTFARRRPRYACSGRGGSTQIGRGRARCGGGLKALRSGNDVALYLLDSDEIW